MENFVFEKATYESNGGGNGKVIYNGVREVIFAGVVFSTETLKDFENVFKGNKSLEFLKKNIVEKNKESVKNKENKFRIGFCFCNIQDDSDYKKDGIQIYTKIVTVDFNKKLISSNDGGKVLVCDKRGNYQWIQGDENIDLTAISSDRCLDNKLGLFISYRGCVELYEIFSNITGVEGKKWDKNNKKWVLNEKSFILSFDTKTNLFNTLNSINNNTIKRLGNPNNINELYCLLMYHNYIKDFGTEISSNTYVVKYNLKIFGSSDIYKAIYYSIKNQAMNIASIDDVRSINDLEKCICQTERGFWCLKPKVWSTVKQEESATLTEVTPTKQDDKDLSWLEDEPKKEEKRDAIDNELDTLVF